MTDFVQSFLVSLDLDGNDITVNLTDITFDETRSVLSKGTMDGSGAMKNIPGMKSGTMSLSGFVDQLEWNKIEATWAKDTEVPFILTIVQGFATDASWAGNLVMGDKSVNPAVDAAWAFSLSGDTSGPVTYTPAVA